jgi:ubiquinone/menaquinone biosynthesis C-methylase UbiE
MKMKENTNTVPEVIEYFRHKAEDYDLVDLQCYWRLSDAILQHLFQTKVLDFLDKTSEGIRFFDAGAGTGRWSLNILDHYSNAKGKLVDLSESMLSVAEKKFRAKGFFDNITIQQDNLDSLDWQQFNGFNLAFSFHNVIGFVEQPARLIANMAKIIEPSGYVVILAPNLYHNVFFNINVNNVAFSESALETHTGRFTSDMPAMHMFTPSSLRTCFEEAGLKNIFISGFPSSIYPQMQETQLHGSTEGLVNLLEDQEQFQRILAIEKQLLGFSDLAARGNQLIAIGQKPS